MITWDTVWTGIILGIIAGIAQTIGSWLILRTVLKKIDERTEQMNHTVEELHLTPAQKSEFAKKLGSESINYVHEYGKTLKSAFFWWRKEK